MAVLWLMMFLVPVSCQLQTKDPNTPIKNLRMEPKSRRLTWDLNGNVTKIECIKDSHQFKEATNNQYCHYGVLSTCNVTNYTVSITNPPFSAWILFPKQDGKPEAAAENLTCWVHDVDFLTCSWALGRAAPSDVQYHLYLKNTSTQKEYPCPHYKKDDQGTHIGCHFDDISRISKYPHQFLILVNGTSKSCSVPCMDIFEDLSYIGKEGLRTFPSHYSGGWNFKIEAWQCLRKCPKHGAMDGNKKGKRLSPPNVTAECNKTHSFMEWEMRSHFNRKFLYELQIEKSTRHVFTEQIQDKNSFELHNPGTYTVKIRVQEYFIRLPSRWSAPQRFVCDHEEDAHTRGWRTSLLVALGTLLALLCAAFLCKRYSVMQKIFPPIPRLKDPISDKFQNDKMMAWVAGRADREDCPVAEVLVVEET
ncbi:PREDICTED: interleukin-3 receptor subunit alpha [Galeopterus variegatus]|uniref:Interleukin-3 receptor subunit alpha n=1 Tax=Galeopterus variegatus TaxID=482537 RepID=A0ABM0QDD2_GALVR|nr:PREDICTED: interleukin-3 receptor subunit alpha [Galeopterus variegatus]